MNSAAQTAMQIQRTFKK